jgi:hypothetical protein
LALTTRRGTTKAATLAGLFAETASVTLSASIAAQRLAGLSFIAAMREALAF